MSRIILILWSFFALQSCAFSSVKEDVSSINDDADKEDQGTPVATLDTFYRAYISEVLKFPPDEARIAALKNRYVSTELLQKLAAEELDSDPFLNAQDVDETVLQTLRVVSAGKPNRYTVSYTAGSQETRRIELTLTQILGSWKISGLANEQGSSQKGAQEDLFANWKISCEANSPALLIENENLVYIDLFFEHQELARLLAHLEPTGERRYNLLFDGLTGITRGNRNLPWEKISQERPVAVISYTNNKLNLHWLGFYDKETNENVLPQSPFGESGDSADLVPCKE